jgi:hypothetical protein
MMERPDRLDVCNSAPVMAPTIRLPVAPALRHPRCLTGATRREAVMRFFDDRDDTPEQVIGDLVGLFVYLALMALLLDAVIPH